MIARLSLRLTNCLAASFAFAFLLQNPTDAQAQSTIAKASDGENADIAVDPEGEETVWATQADVASPDKFFLPTIANLPNDNVASAVETFRAETVARLEQPYGMDFLPDGRLLVTESTPGRLRIVETGVLQSEPVDGIPSGPELSDHFKRRLLDVAVHPTNGWIYLTSAEGLETGPGARLVLSRGHIRDNQWVDGEILLQLDTPSTAGARIAFDPEGHVYVGTIDAEPEVEGGPNQAQDLSTPGGKILRLMPDGSVPPDNPFLDRQDAYPYVWAYGIRAPLGLAFDNEGRLWDSENGPRGGDELNLIQRGKNYGWPVITWGHPYDETPTVSRVDQEGMEQPVVSWTPSPAVAGAAYHHGGVFPNWKGSIFITSLKQMTLYRITFDGDRMNLMETMLVGSDRLRDVDVDEAGRVYVITDGGTLFRLVPAKAD